VADRARHGLATGRSDADKLASDQGPLTDGMNIVDDQTTIAV
jgi:hypothetical protein